MELPYDEYMTHYWQSLFYPKSIAIVGASATIGSVGYSLVSNVTSRFQGSVHLVNPKTTTILGIPCVSHLVDISDPVDLVLCAVPAHVVGTIVQEAGEKGVKSMIIISAGFKESGEEGAKREQELVKLGTKYGMTIIGPNCLGVINPEIGMNASFAPDIPTFGGAAFVSQSGALCTAVIDYAKHLNLGFSKFVSIGNKACIDEVDLFEYFASDEKTLIVLAYIEDVTKIPEFLKNAQKLTAGPNAKPVLLLKSGKSDEGKAASVSHTGALGGKDIYYDALFHQAGVLRVDTIPELFTAASSFLYNPLPKGNNVAVITNAGGPGILVTDAAIAAGLSVPPLTTSTCSLLVKTVASITTCHNPIDLLGDATTDRYEKALAAVCADDAIDSLLVLLTPQGGTPITEIATSIVEVKKTTDKPIVVSFMGQHRVLPGVDVLKNGNVAVCDYPEDAAKALGLLVEFTRLSKQIRTSLPVSEKVRGKQLPSGMVPEYEAMTLLTSYRFPTVKSGFAANVADAKAVMNLLQVSCSMKIMSPDITHKSDVGGVMLDVTSDTVISSYEKMMEQVKKNAPNAKIEGVLLVEMVKEKGIELIIGATRDPLFGVMVMVGYGGVTVEVFNDTAFGIAPLTKENAMEMINRLQVKKLFDHFRGGPSFKRETVIDVIGKVQQLMNDHPEISELDINPCILLPGDTGAKIVDVRIRVA
jgi:acetyl coenzyme A synthetase (ADP forming)-like protein